MFQQLGRGGEGVRLLLDLLFEVRFEAFLGAFAHNEAAAHGEEGLVGQLVALGVQGDELDAIGVARQDRQRVLNHVLDLGVDVLAGIQLLSKAQDAGGRHVRQAVVDLGGQHGLRLIAFQAEHDRGEGAVALARGRQRTVDVDADGRQGIKLVFAHYVCDERVRCTHWPYGVAGRRSDAYRKEIEYANCHGGSHP